MIYICQLLCPERHCIMAQPVELPDDAPADKLEELADLRRKEDYLFSQYGVNRRCGICGSTVLKWDIRKSKFKTREEACNAMMAGHASQMLSRALLDMLGASYDSQQQLKNN